MASASTLLEAACGKLFAALIGYVVLVGVFHQRSAGFSISHTVDVCFWKVTPITLLAGLLAYDGLGLPEKARWRHFWGLAFGGLGDVLIAASPRGIVPGAVAFGIGHVCYMSIFLPQVRRVWLWPFGLVAIVWSLIIGHFCLQPVIATEPWSAFILSFYSTLLNTALIGAASLFKHGGSKTPAGLKGAAWRLAGFAAFVSSDSLLIFATTGYWTPFGEHLILALYFLAQFLLLRATVESELQDALRFQ